MTTTRKIEVTTEQIEFYNENGYILFEKLLDDEMLARLQEETDRIVSEAAGLSEHNNQYDLEDSHTPENPRVRRLKAPHQHWPFF